MFEFIGRLFGDRQVGTIQNPVYEPILENKIDTGIVVDNKLASNIKSVNIEDASQNLRLSSYVSAIFTRVHKDRVEYRREFDAVKNFYIIDTILCNMSEDALTPDISTGDILSVHSKDTRIQNELASFQKKFNLDNIINDITYDLLGYGEYSLRLDIKEGEGIVEIIDDIDQNTILAFYKEGFPFRYLRRLNDKLILSSPHKYANFILSARKIRIEALSELGVYGAKLSSIPPEIEALPKFVRVGRPLLYGTLSKIKELMLLEQLVPAIKLAQLTNGSIVSIEVPPTTSPKDAFDIARKYEQLFNKKLGVDKTTSGIGVSDILAVAGRVKVIPTFGNKGQAQTVDVGVDANTSDIQNSITDSREVICTSAGIPSELLFGGASRSEMLKKYARYLRKIKAIQQAIAKGVLQICLSHLNNLKGMPTVAPSDIEISFKNETVNIDELEKLEYYDATLSMIKNTVDFVQSVDQGETTAGAIDSEDFKKWINAKLEFIKFSNLNKEDKAQPPKPKPIKPTRKIQPGPGEEEPEEYTDEEEPVE